MGNTIDPMSSSALFYDTAKKTKNKSDASSNNGQTESTSISNTARLLEFLSNSAQQPASVPALSPGEQAFVNQIASDPSFAMQQTQQYASSTEIFSLPPAMQADFAALFKSGKQPPFADTQALATLMQQNKSMSNSIAQQRQALYQSDLAKGIAPAQMFMDQLKFNLTLPDSYKQVTGGADRYGLMQAQLNSLESLVSTGNNHQTSAS